MRSMFGMLALVGLVGCGASGSDVDDDPSDPSEVAYEGVALLGDGANDPEAVSVTVILDELLDTPRDLAFNPEAPEQLWVLNQGTQSVTVVFEPGTAGQSAEHFRDTGTGPHFLARPSGIAFGKSGAMATVHDTDEKTQGPNGTPGDFMGPTLWTTDLDLFDGGHASHLDMLHNTPLGKGIAWEDDNVYWLFDAYHKSVTRYDFQEDHGLGGAYHGDGIISRYAEGEVKGMNNGMPSHLWYDRSTNLLYIADTGNSRIAVLDTTTGGRGEDTRPNYDGCDQFEVLDSVLTTLVDGAEIGLERPSGLDVHGGVLYVSDAKNSAIFAFDLEGKPLDRLDLPDYKINGIAVSPSGDALYFVDPAGKVVRIGG